mmetsp:Transcript_24153/g.39118  ORF Transcript_24153/g.39118 Transcript_24153/m.39118 type:complete len:260 (+) Transcript_24153:2877-3656(+)
MSNLRFDTPNSDLFLLVAVCLLEEVAKSGKFDLVPNRSPGSVSLDKCHGTWVDTCTSIGTAKGLFLSRDGRGIDPGSLSITGRCARADYGMDIIPIAHSIRVTLQYHHTRSLTNQHTLGRFIVRLYTLVRGKDGGFGKGHVHTDSIIRAGCTSNHGIGIPIQKLLDGNLDGNERARTCGVNDAIHTLHVKGVAASAGSYIAKHPRKGVEAPFWKVGLVLFYGHIDILLWHAHLGQYLFNDNIVEARVKLVARLLATPNS